MFMMLGFARAVAFAAVVTAGVLGPRVVESCTPGQLHAELLAPSGGDSIPTHAVFWFSIRGLGPAGAELNLDLELVGSGDTPIPVTVSSAPPSSSEYGPASLEDQLRVEAELEPNTAYALSYTKELPTTLDGEPMRATRTFFTAADVAADPPPSPTAELAFAATASSDPLPFPCAAGEFDEVTMIMVNATGATAIHARTKYSDEAEFSHPITHVLRPGAGGDTMFVWAEDRGLPCVELVAEGPDGRRSEPTVVCEAVGCVSGEEWSKALGRSADWWREEHGPRSCLGVPAASEDPARGCACVAVPEGGARDVGVIAGLMLMLMGLVRGRSRRVDPAAGASLPQTFIVAACAFSLSTACSVVAESEDAGQGLDVLPPNVMLDAEVELDASGPDLEPQDSGATSCQVFCSAHSDCLAARSVQGLEYFGDEVHCVTETPGLAACATRCEALDPSEDCLECSSMCSGRCDAVCPGIRLSDTQWLILEHQTCWFGGPRPTEACADPRLVTNYSGTARPEDAAETFMIEYSGTATVVSSEEMVVRTPSGSEIRLGIGIWSEVPVPALELGSTVQVQVSSSCSIWGCSSAFVLRDEEGTLIATGWSNRGPMPVPELELRYEGRSCLPIKRENYFELELELVADSSRIQTGQYAEVGDFYVFNGRSSRYYAITVTDTPLGESSGVVFRKQ